VASRKQQSKKKKVTKKLVRNGAGKAINDKLVFIFPDIHFPHHDKKALECALRAHEALRPGRTIQLGDMLDCDIFSSHVAVSIDDTRGYDFIRDEIEPARAFTDRCLKNTRKYIQMAGNHEYRIERRCIDWGTVGMSVHGMINPQRLLGQDRGVEWEWVPYVNAKVPMSYYRICKSLIAVHGWSFGRHAARIHLDATRDSSVVFGHIHRQQAATTRNPFTGQILRAWSVGCLSELQPLYQTDGKPTEWVHGFGLVYVGSDGRKFSEYTVTIENGSCVLPDGTQIKV